MLFGGEWLPHPRIAFDPVFVHLIFCVMRCPGHYVHGQGKEASTIQMKVTLYQCSLTRVESQETYATSDFDPTLPSMSNICPLDNGHCPVQKCPKLWISMAMASTQRFFGCASSKYGRTSYLKDRSLHQGCICKSSRTNKPFSASIVIKMFFQ